jgi:hypothetical protein
MSPVYFVTRVLSTLRSSAPRARKGFPQASALRLCSPSPFPLPLRFVSRVGDPPPLALANPVALLDVSALTIVLGSGDRVVTNHQIAARNELGTFSRAVFTGFCDSLISGEDPFSGGAPQLVGLYRNGSGMHFGTILRGKSYYRGLEAAQLSVPQIEWRNELFERCDSSGKRIEGAQAQPRLRGCRNDPH